MRAFKDLCIACEFIEFAMKRNTVTSDILIEPERGINSYTNNACTMEYACRLQPVSKLIPSIVAHVP